MTIVTLIQARSTSTRLPQKVLLTLDSTRTVLDWVYLRAQRITQSAKTVIVCPHDDSDLLKFFWERELPYTACDPPRLADGRNDVLARFALAAQRIDADAYVRITADCPFVSPCLADDVIAKFLRLGMPYCANVEPALDGFDVEVFTSELLTQADCEATDPHDRHHVTPWMRAEMSRRGFLDLDVRGLAGPSHCPQPQVHGLNLSIDTLADYYRCYRLAQEITITDEWPTIVQAARRWRALAPEEGA